MDLMFILWIAKQLAEDTGWNHYKASINTELFFCLRYELVVSFSIKNQFILK